MHSTAYSTREQVRLIPPYREGGDDFPPANGRPVRGYIRDCVRVWLEEQAEQDGRVWWARRPYVISVRDVSIERGRGAYVWHVEPVDTIDVG